MFFFTRIHLTGFYFINTRSLTFQMSNGVSNPDIPSRRHLPFQSAQDLRTFSKRVYGQTEEEWIRQCHTSYNPNIHWPILSSQEVFGTEIQKPECPICKNRNTRLISRQRRSADEPTQFECHCETCGRRTISN